MIGLSSRGGVGACRRKDGSVGFWTSTLGGGTGKAVVSSMAITTS